MCGPRKHFAMGLVLLLCALTGRSVCAPSAASPTGYAQQKEREDFRRLVEAVRHVDESRVRGRARIDAPFSYRSRVSALEARDLRSSRMNRGEMVSVFPRTSKKKEKFIQHHTGGPLYFSHKCRKHAYRLYHQTRDCTIPAYYKRCARLLTRLAGSPQCVEG
uniref:ALK and LTK ligand 2 n=1 Tax=Neogobius melanostomus TaxID=47308 RepID=A0A8C6WJG3_9GOBI